MDSFPLSNMNQEDSQGLRTLLSTCLPQGEQFFILQLQNLPTETHPIITPKSKCPSPLTIKNQHFFSLFHHEKVIYALEIYVYLTLWGDSNRPAERLIFVSKADTNGYCDIKLSFKAVTKTLIQYVMGIDPNYYLQRIKPRVRDYNQEPELLTQRTDPIRALRILSKRQRSLVSSSPPIPNNFYLSMQFPPKYSTTICLFTRPAPQYLFAESSKNPGKHCLDGAQLLNWWLSILDDILCENFERTSHAKLQIPGEVPAEIKRHLKNVRFTNWQVGDVFSHCPGELAAYTVPLFPDDPKTRFLRQLVEENRIKSTDLRTFWIELAERQEFRLSVRVSVMGAQGTIKNAANHVPSHNEIFTASAKKNFEYIKSYITGEDYNTEDGALEAFANIRDFFSIRLNQPLQAVLGANIRTQADHPKRLLEPKVEHVITTLTTRKKLKN